jgi:hypothetical protein
VAKVGGKKGRIRVSYEKRFISAVVYSSASSMACVWRNRMGVEPGC